MIKVGLMGCGTVADYGHLPAIAQTDGLKLVALFDPSEQRLEKMGAKFGIDEARRFTHADAFFESGIDAVAVTSPGPMHYENVLAAAKHGKHVLCEKPLAESEQQGREMIAAMQRANRILVVGFIFRFSGMYGKVRELMRSGAIGEPRSLRLIYIWDGHGKFVRNRDVSVIHPKDGINMRRDRFMREGGPIIDCGVHQIDMARWWSGSEIERISGHGTFIDDYDCPDHVYIHMDHANGVHSMIESSFSYGHTAKDPQSHYRNEAIGTDGVVRFHRDTNVFELANADGTTTFEFKPEKNFHAMYAQFRRAIETGDIGNFATAEDGIIATKIAREAVEQIKKSSPRRDKPASVES